MLACTPLAPLAPAQPTLRPLLPLAGRPLRSDSSSSSSPVFAGVLLLLLVCACCFCFYQQQQQQQVAQGYPAGGVQMGGGYPGQYPGQVVYGGGGCAPLPPLQPELPPGAEAARGRAEAASL